MAEIYKRWYCTEYPEEGCVLARTASEAEKTLGCREKRKGDWLDKTRCPLCTGPHSIPWNPAKDGEIVIDLVDMLREAEGKVERLEKELDGVDQG